MKVKDLLRQALSQSKRNIEDWRKVITTPKLRQELGQALVSPVKRGVTSVNTQFRLPVRRELLKLSATPFRETSVGANLELVGRNLEPLVGGRPTATSQAMARRLGVFKPMARHLTNYLANAAIAGKSLTGQYKKPGYRLHEW